MSTFCYGKIIFTEEINIFTEEQYSYDIILKTVQNRFGIFFGGNIPNVTQNIISQLGDDYGIYFGITDDFLSNNAETIFSEDGVKCFSGSIRIDNGDNLKSRLTKLKNVFQYILSIKGVIEIRLICGSNIGSVEDMDYKDEVNIATFINKLLLYYNDDNNKYLKPDFNLVIKKS